MVARLLWCIAFWSALYSTAHASDRVALVIGNGAYEHTVQLANPRNDADAIAAALQGVGFEVIKGVDLDEQGMENTLREFVRAIDDAKLVVFYYSGHGLQVDGKNYLVPVDADLTDRASLDFQTVDADKIFGYMGADQRVALAFLDACRDNPLARTYARAAGATRSVASGGLAAPATAGTGLFIGFATAPDDVASDGKGKNSPFTAAMLKYLATPGLEINQLMTRVKAEVRAATEGGQRPWSNSDLDVDVYLVPAAPVLGEASDQKAEAIDNLREALGGDRLVPGEPGPEDALKAVINGPAYIQLSSQPTAADAQSSLRATRANLTGIVDTLNLEIRQVDLGSKGLWYRVVLPTRDFQDAVTECAKLKARGTQCVAING